MASQAGFGPQAIIWRPLIQLISSDLVCTQGYHEVLQPFHWRCVECAVYHEQDVREE